MKRTMNLVSMLFFLHVFRSTWATNKPPHIIFMVADDLGWNDVGWHNNKMKTPNLDRLAREGVILNSSYVQPLCTPSRTAFMTGYYPFHTGLQHGVLDSHTPTYLYTNFTLLPQKLRHLNYTTHMLGKWHLGFCKWEVTPTYRGFNSFMGYYGGGQDYYLHTEGPMNGHDFRLNKNVYYPPQGEYSTKTYAKRAVKLIETHDPNDKPMFLYVAFQSVHSPLQVPKEYEDLYPSETNANRKSYSGMVSAMDEVVGNITDALEKYGYIDNTVIIFTSDNGGSPSEGANNLPLRGTKGTLWEGGTKAAAFVYSKTLLQQKGYVNSELIHAVDWFPTLLSIAGGSPDKQIDGVTLWSTISKNTPSPRTEFIYNIDDITNSSAIRMGDYKLLDGIPGHHNDWYQLPDGHGASHRPHLRVTGQHLYNIKDDPTEQHDMAHAHPDIVNKMKARLDQYKQTMVPSFQATRTMASSPRHFNGNWSPGWC